MQTQKRKITPSRNILVIRYTHMSYKSEVHQTAWPSTTEADGSMRPKTHFLPVNTGALEGLLQRSKLHKHTFKELRYTVTKVVV